MLVPVTIQTGLGGLGLHVAHTSYENSSPLTTEGAALMGTYEAIFKPLSGTSTLIATSIMRKAVCDSSNGAWSGLSHTVGGFDFLVTQGDNAIAQAFGHEIRIEQDCTDTITELTAYKPVLVNNAGTVTRFITYDAPNTSLITGLTESWLMRNSTSKELKIETVGKIIGASGLEVASAKHPGIAVGRRYSALNARDSLTASTLFTIGWEWAIPIYIPERTTFDKIGCEVTTAVASSNIRLGIRKAAAGVASDLVLDAGQVDSSSTGAKEATISQELEAGVYFLTAAAQDGASAPSINWISTDGFSGIFGIDTSNTVASCMYATGSTGALPSSYGTVNYSGTALAPFVWLRKTT